MADNKIADNRDAKIRAAVTLLEEAGWTVISGETVNRVRPEPSLGGMHELDPISLGHVDDPHEFQDYVYLAYASKTHPLGIKNIELIKILEDKLAALNKLKAAIERYELRSNSRVADDDLSFPKEKYRRIDILSQRIEAEIKIGATSVLRVMRFNYHYERVTESALHEVTAEYEGIEAALPRPSDFKIRRSSFRNWHKEWTPDD